MNIPTYRTIGEAWLNTCQQCMADGREYEIQHGSYVGQRRKQLDRLAFAITPLLPGSGQVNLPIAACLKEALISDIGSLLASHLSLELIGQEVGFPSARDPSPEGWPNALQDFALVGGDVEDENESRKRLLHRARGSVMPVYFSRSRDFALLMDKDRGRFFAWLKLLPAKHPLGQETIVDRGNLIDMNTGEVFKKKSTSALLFPISLGRRKTSGSGN